MCRAWSLVLCLVPFASAIADEAADKEIKALQGEWIWVQHEVGGKVMEPPAADRPVIKIEQAKWFLKDKASGNFKEVGTFQLDVMTTPRCVDLISTDEKTTGQKNEAIYKLEEDKLTVVLNLNADDKSRPMDFKTAEKPGMILVELERKK